MATIETAHTPLLRRKRARNDPSGFTLTFMNPQLLRNLIEVISGVLTETAIQVMVKDDFEGILIENLDVRGVCVVIAQLACKVSVSDTESRPRFTLSVETFLIALKQVLSHYTLEISMKADAADLMLTSLDTTGSTAPEVEGKIVTMTKLTTLHAPVEQVEFDTMTYSFTIQIKKNDLYSIVKSAKDYSANHITMSVYQQTVDDVVHIMYCLSCQGTSASSDYYFHSKVEQGVIKVETDDSSIALLEFDETHLQLREMFNVQYILTFLKAMDHKMITLRLSKSKPLIVIYGLGAEDSFAMFILGGKTDEAD
jgi:Cu/Ag efflux protein CusF